MDYTKTIQKKPIKVKFFENELIQTTNNKYDSNHILTIEILVFINNKILARYCRHFDKKVSALHYHEFIKKFLEDTTYRKQFHYDRKHWNGSIRYQYEEGVNQQCRKLIQQLNQIKRAKFDDFAELKTFGVDGFSRMNLEKLSTFVKPSDIRLVEQAFQEKKLQLSALRWVARGLKVRYAIRKVRTDLELHADKDAKNFAMYIGDKSSKKKKKKPSNERISR